MEKENTQNSHYSEFSFSKLLDIFVNFSVPTLQMCQFDKKTLANQFS